MVIAGLGLYTIMSKAQEYFWKLLSFQEQMVLLAITMKDADLFFLKRGLICA